MCQGNPIGAGFSVAVMRPSKIKENNKNIVLNIIFIQTEQMEQCVKHIL